MTYDELEARIAAWAAAQPAIRAVIVIGSRARGNADQWSDLDLLILTTDPARYAADPGWTSAFGEVWLTYMEPTGLGDPEWYIVFAGGLKIDAVLLRVDDAALDLEALVEPFDDWDAFRRGANVIFDRSGAPRALPPKPPKSRALPTAAEYDNVVSGVLLAALTTAKFVARGDYWRAQRWFANDLHPHLLTLAEWQAQAAQPGRDTWYAGRFLDDWADARVIAALPQLFPQYDRASLSAALIALLDLTRWLGGDVAEKLGFRYPAQAHDRIAELMRTILAES